MCVARSAASAAGKHEAVENEGKLRAFSRAITFFAFSEVQGSDRAGSSLKGVAEPVVI